MKTMFVVVLFGVSIVGAGCGDDGGSGEADSAPISLFDATPPDAAPPDAFVCTQTMCGNDCVDLETDPLHCGECGNACVPAASCGGVGVGCECPDNFVPETVTTIFEQFDSDMLPPLTLGVGIGAGTDGNTHAFIGGVELGETEVGVDIDLATSENATFAVLYQFSGMSAKAFFLATEGTINFDRACEDGMGGTLTDVVLAEGTTSGEVLPGGCSVTVPTATFSYGSDCAPKK